MDDLIARRGLELFAKPWHAQAFALVLHLHDQSLFSWEEWSHALGAVRASQESPDKPDAYYIAWVDALGHLMIQKGILDEQSSVAMLENWRRAYLSTPHGSPVLLNGSL